MESVSRVQVINSAHKEKSFHMRKVSTNFICLLLSSLGAVDRKQESLRVEAGGFFCYISLCLTKEKYVIQAVILLFGNK